MTMLQSPEKGVKRSLQGVLRNASPPSIKKRLPDKRQNSALPSITRDVARRQGTAPLEETNDFIIGTEEIVATLYSDGQAQAEGSLVTGEAKMKIGPSDQEPKLSRAVFISDLLLRLHHPPQARGKNALAFANSRGPVGSSTHPGEMSSLPNETAVPKVLISWLDENHNEWEQTLQTVENTRPNPAVNTNFWDVVFNLVLRGKIQRAISLLRSSDFLTPSGASEDGQTESYTKTQVANIYAAIREATEIMRQCPAIRDDDWHVTGIDWSRFRGLVNQALHDLNYPVEGRKQDAGALHQAGSVEIRSAMSSSQNNREATSYVPWSIYQNLRALYGVLLGSEAEVLSSAQDWIEATVGLTVWWNGHEEERLAVGDLSKTKRSLRKYQSEGQRLVDMDPEAAYVDRLRTAFHHAIDDNDDFSFQVNSNSLTQVALASVFEGDFQGILSLLRSWSLPVAVTVAEIATLGGWSTTTISPNTFSDELDESDLMVLDSYHESDVGLRRDTLMKEYSNAVSSHGPVEYDEKGKLKREGWQLAVDILARLGDEKLSKTEIRKVLYQQDLVDDQHVDMALSICTRCDMAQEARTIATNYADHVSKNTESYGTMLLYYARAGLETRVRDVLDLLISVSLVRSTSFPSTSSLDATLGVFLNIPCGIFVNIAENDPAAAALLHSLFTGYAALREFYDIRDNEIQRKATEDSTMEIARKEAAFRRLITITNSAADNIHGGLYDDHAGAVINVDGLLVLLGEVSVFVDESTGLLPLAQCLHLLKIVEDLEAVDQSTFDRCDNFYRSTIASYHDQAKRLSPPQLLKSMSSKSDTSSFSLVGDSMLNSLDSEDMDGNSSAGKSQQAIKRGWDWREGTSKSDTGVELLRRLRGGLARDIAKHWNDDDDDGEKVRPVVSRSFECKVPSLTCVLPFFHTMKLSFLSVLLLLAAGSDARRFKKYRRDCNPQVGGAGNGTAQSGQKAAQFLALSSSSASSAVPLGSGDTTNGTTEGSGENSTTSDTTGITSVGNGSTVSLQPGGTTNPPASGSNGCPGFRNVVFNTVAGKAPGFPDTTWSTLAGLGVDGWIGFSLSTLDKKQSYAPIKSNDALNAAQVHMVMDRNDIAAGIDMLKTSPPDYLALYNEPDSSYLGYTLTATPGEAATQLKDFFSTPHPKTKYLSPGCAQDLPWLTQFRDACAAQGINCMGQIDVISYHIYSHTAQGVIDGCRELHTTFPDQKIWLTELSPSSTHDCTMDETAMIQWMKDVYKGIQGLNAE
ncbi:uncharacterized protein KY384_001502 [Bacidia gigantensis]|uniref:uncharacterized protein n=1 Tax=Bacidia gigantensis TaxID=2732470 RepID=UPI001D044581|nr:uncharacterized protein KY384_001502 [Bacidia gigantensis]KAG8533761.1 hypothetical protein KY384_001502 [Bacidia gigantensis]